ncbi:MAG TPA: cytochrome P450 [Capsulimonadaceae bacterium]|nr:cytochrome P450 [Capsulimonadaceae bacterium]
MPQEQPNPFVDPYPGYQWMRAQGPVFWDTKTERWIVVGYSEVVSALRDPRFSAERMSLGWLSDATQGDLHILVSALASQMLFQDPPDHTRLRALVSKAFSARTIDSMRPRIQMITDDLLDRATESGQMDLIQDLAYPLPITVIAEMLGVPIEDRDKFKRWSDDFITFISHIANPDQDMRTLQSVLELTEYFRKIIADVKEHPKDDLLSALAAAEERGDVLSEEELLSNCMLILAAGHETTINLIGNGMLALLTHPDQKQKLRDNTALIAPAVEEFLRYDSPVQWTGRILKGDVELGGQSLRTGQGVNFCLGAANRDPAQFSDPETLDITRAENKHIAFGFGTHFCLGAALARLEGQVAIGTLLARFPNLKLAVDSSELKWHENYTFRGLCSLPVSLG